MNSLAHNSPRAHLRALLLAVLGSAASAVVLAQSAPSTYTTGTRYDAMRRVVGVISPDPDAAGPLAYAAVRNTYDAAGRLVRIEKGQLSAWQGDAVAPAAWTGFTIYQTVDTSYDGLDRKRVDQVSASGTAYTATQFSYDGPGRLLCTAVRMNPAAYGALPGDACTLGSQGSYGPDRITHNVYDNAGKLLKIQRAYGTALQQDYSTFTYSANGKQTTTTDANGNLSQLTYDGFDRLAQMNFPSKTTPGSASSTDFEQYAFDANGNRTYLKKRDNQVINYSFDTLDRLSVKDVPGTSGDVYYAYDVRGHQLYARFASTSGVGITNVFDGFGRITSSTNNTDGTNRTLSYLYDADSNRIRLTFPDSNFFTFGYDGLDRMTSIVQSGSTTVATIAYDSQGRRSSLTGGVTTNYGYDPVSRLASLSHNLSGTAQDVTYTYASYNPASQMLSQARNNDSYAWTSAVNTNRNYAVNGLNQYTTVGVLSPVYDSNGNLTADGSSTYNYDAENRLTSASGATNAILSYDPAGRLFQVTGTTTTRFLYDGDDLVAEYNGSGTLLRRYVHGPVTDDPILWYEGTALTTRRQMRTDHQGSVVAVTDANGVSVALDKYDEYGVPAVGNLGRFQYTGQILVPEINLYYYKARIYSPAWGRFLQTDPIGYKDDNNLYAYVGNDPTDKTDPSGLDAIDDFVAGASDQTNITVNGGTALDRPEVDRTSFAYSFGQMVIGAAVAMDSSLPNGGPMIVSRSAMSGATANSASRSVGSPGVAIPGNPAGARIALGEAGYKGTPSTRTSEAGTIHTLPGKDGKMDVRVMDGSEAHPPRAVTTRAGTNDPARPDGSRFKNNESRQERRTCSHIKLDDPC